MSGRTSFTATPGRGPYKIPGTVSLLPGSAIRIESLSSTVASQDEAGFAPMAGTRSGGSIADAAKRFADELVNRIHGIDQRKAQSVSIRSVPPVVSPRQAELPEEEVRTLDLERPSGVEVSDVLRPQPDASVLATVVQRFQEAGAHDEGTLDGRQLFSALAELGASDLYLCVGQRPRMRRQGQMFLIPGFENPPSEEAILDMLKEVLDESELPLLSGRECVFSTSLEGVCRLRIRLFRDGRGTGAAIRIIPEEVPTFSSLDLPKSLDRLCFARRGLVLVAGPSGSGRSTTLAAMLDRINHVRCSHIVTIERPIEYLHYSTQCLVSQRATTTSFASAARAAIAEAPDILLFSEIDEVETARTVLEIADTGALVFAAVRANSAPQALERVVSMFPLEEQRFVQKRLARVVRAVTAQTLCTDLTGKQRGAFEVLFNSSSVQTLIREGDWQECSQAIEKGKSSGMQSLNDALLDLVERQLIEAEEALDKSMDKFALGAALQRAGCRGLAAIDVEAGAA